MQTPTIWGEPETSYIRRFMDGVDKVVTDEMQSGRSLLEESLTFVLARLLDGQLLVPLLVQSSPIEPKYLAFFTAGASSKSIVRFKMSGSIVRLSAHDEVCNG